MTTVLDPEPGQVAVAEKPHSSLPNVHRPEFGYGRSTAAGASPVPLLKTWRGLLPVLSLTLGLAVTVYAGFMAGRVHSQEQALAERIAAVQQLQSAVNDSLYLARRYDSLSAEVLDLQQELHARGVGLVPPEIHVFSVPSAPGGPLVGSRPVPSFFRTEPTPEDRQAAARELTSRPPTWQGIRGIYTQNDFADTGALQALKNRGFTFSRRQQSSSGPTNSIAFGSAIPLADVLQVAYQMIASGLQVKRIRLAPEESRRDNIEMTYSREVLDWPELSVEDLKRFSGAAPLR